MTLGKRIDELRTAKGFGSVNALAKAAGVSQSVLREIIEGITTDPRLGTLQKLADALGVDVADLSTNTKPSEGVESFDWFWEARFSRADLSALLDLRNAPVERRVTWCLEQLLTAYALDEIAAKLGTETEHLNNLFSGQDRASNHLVDRLEQVYSVPASFVYFGQIPEINELLRRAGRHPEFGTWLVVINKATDHGILPELVLRYIDLLLTAKGGNNKTPTS